MRAMRLLLCALLSLPAFAAPCFELSKPVTGPLRESLPLSKSGDAADQGKDQHAWARLRGVVKRPIGALTKWLEDPSHFPDPSIDELTVKRLDAGALWARFEVHQLVKPFPLVRVEWTDEWAFTLTRGTREQPERVVIAYQKREGTAHIEHYCGTIVLERLDDGTTDVALAEESTITGKDKTDVAKGLAWFLGLLRKS